MGREEFINVLRIELNKTNDKVLIDNNIRYYNYYFDTELAKGRSIDDILNELGDPRLIANTIKTAAGYEEIFDNGRIEVEEDKIYDDKTKKAGIFDKIKNFFTDEKYKAYIIVSIFVAIFILVLLLVFTVVKKIIMIFWPLIVVYIIYRIIEAKRRRRF